MLHAGDKHGSLTDNKKVTTLTDSIPLQPTLDASHSTLFSDTHGSTLSHYYLLTNYVIPPSFFDNNGYAEG